MNQHQKALEWAEQYLNEKAGLRVLERQSIVETPWSVVYGPILRPLRCGAKCNTF